MFDDLDDAGLTFLFDRLDKVSSDNFLELIREAGLDPISDLAGAQLDAANLEFLDLCGANLRGTSLSRAKLRSSILTDANLSYALLHSSDLSYADLSNADLSFATLNFATMRGAFWADTVIESTDLSFANLEGLIVRNVDFSTANLSGISPIVAEALITEGLSGKDLIVRQNGISTIKNGAEINVGVLGEAGSGKSTILAGLHHTGRTSLSGQSKHLGIQTFEYRSGSNAIRLFEIGSYGSHFDERLEEQLLVRCDALIVVFNVTDRFTRKLVKQLELVRASGTKWVLVVLNKCDLVDDASIHSVEVYLEKVLQHLGFADHEAHIIRLGAYASIGGMAHREDQIRLLRGQLNQLAYQRRLEITSGS